MIIKFIWNLKKFLNSLRRWMINEGIWYMFNHIYAWTIPAILMVIVDAKHTIKPSLGVDSCWFHRKKNIYD